MIRNLLDNAINYTPSSPNKPGVITARVLADPFGHVLILQVEDSGPGIPEAERELVFQPFYRALGTNVDGSGLGLPIVLEIASQHGASASRWKTPTRRRPRPAGLPAREACGFVSQAAGFVKVQLQPLALDHPLHRRQQRHRCTCAHSSG
jgi:two-component system sensor histidine kinase TctE